MKKYILIIMLLFATTLFASITERSGLTCDGKTILNMDSVWDCDLSAYPDEEICFLGTAENVIDQINNWKYDFGDLYYTNGKIINSSLISLMVVEHSVADYFFTKISVCR